MSSFDVLMCYRHTPVFTQILNAHELFLFRYEHLPGQLKGTLITTFKVEVNIVQAMLDCVRSYNVTLATICTACYAAFLFELTGNWDVVFRTFVACRPTEYEAKDLLGNFFHIPIIRVKLEDSTATFIDLLHAVEIVLIDSVQYGRYAESPPEKDLPKCDDEASCKLVDPPISGFHFHQMNNDLILDSSNDISLNYLYNDRDGILVGFQARVGTICTWSTDVFYKPHHKELLFAQFFSVAAYDQLVSVSA